MVHTVLSAYEIMTERPQSIRSTHLRGSLCVGLTPTSGDLREEEFSELFELIESSMSSLLSTI